MAEAMPRCHAITRPAPRPARRRPQRAAPTAAPLAAVGNQALQRALAGTVPAHSAPAEELEQATSTGCACGASRAAPVQWMGAPPARSCGLAEDGGGATYDEDVTEEGESDAGDFGLGDFGLGDFLGDLFGFRTDEKVMVGRQPGTSVRPDLQPWAGGAATIVCNGSGGYRVALNSWAGAPCGIEGCVRQHEEQHATDWRGRWPDGCKGKKDGDQIPLGGAGYAAFLKASECSAYTVEENCIAPLLKNAKGKCKTRLDAHLKDTRAQKAKFC